MKILVTGCAGFIGYHVSSQLLNKFKKYNLVGIDNLDPFYDLNLKINRLKKLKQHKKKFIFIKANLSSKKKITKIFNDHKFEYVLHFAAQAGVRLSIRNPEKYFNSNLKGFFNILDLSRSYKIRHFIFASSSSVYGNSTNNTFSETDNTDKPVSFYAATKKSNELMAYSYSSAYGIPTTGLRLFTVYGPFGRSDMAIFKFTKSILEKKTINLYNQGKNIRDFTYIDDVSKAVINIINKPSKNHIPYQIFNIGSSRTLSNFKLLKLIEKNLKTKSVYLLNKAQLGDVKKTHSNNSRIRKKIRFMPKNSVKKGLNKFLKWYKEYFKKIS